MTISDAWLDLHRTRLAELPLDCGNDADPGIIYGPDLRDWSNKATTPDQARIERYIDRYDLRTKSILHVGIGNSGLARRFSRRVKSILGTTIDQPEINVARSLDLRNYRVVLHNKFTGETSNLAGQFDFIIDNNPTSPCCCLLHLAKMFDLYRVKLSPEGQFVTDLGGLRWVPCDTNPRWSFSYEDLSELASVVGLRAFKMTKTVYVLAAHQPSKPSYAALGRHFTRRAVSLPKKAVIRAARRFRVLFAKSARTVLPEKALHALRSPFRGHR